MKFGLAVFAADGVLATSQLGQKVFAALVSQTLVPSSPTLCYLDFQDVAVATTSFLRDGPLAYRNHARTQWPNLYPVGANLNANVREELQDFLRAQGDAFVVCTLDRQDRPSEVEVVGQLDGKQLATLRAVLELGDTDAPRLAAKFKAHEDIGPTAWNNRLTALSTKGILIEESVGRTKQYRPVLENLKYGA